MNPQTQDLETRAREVLKIVEYHGAAFVRTSPVHNPHLQYGLENGLYNKEEVDAADTKFRKTKAREVLKTVEYHGAAFVRNSRGDNSHLQYGLENGLYNKEEVDAADTKFRKTKAREVLKIVEDHGVAFVRNSRGDNSHLQYGLENGLYNKEEVDAADTKFRKTKAREVLKTVEDHGAAFVLTSPVHNPHFQYGLEKGLFDQEEVHAAQRIYENSRKK